MMPCNVFGFAAPFSFMKSFSPLLPLLLVCFPAVAQTIFNQHFVGGYSGTFSVNSYVSARTPTNTPTTVLASGGDPKCCLHVTMKTTTSNDGFNRPDLLP